MSSPKREVTIAPVHDEIICCKGVILAWGSLGLAMVAILRNTRRYALNYLSLGNARCYSSSSGQVEVKQFEVPNSKLSAALEWSPALGHSAGRVLASLRCFLKPPLPFLVESAQTMSQRHILYQM